jgi:hypothetical protein
VIIIGFAISSGEHDRCGGFRRHLHVTKEED